MMNPYYFSKRIFILFAPLLFSCNGADTKIADQKTEPVNAVNTTRQFTREMTYAFKDESQKFVLPDSKSREIALPSGTQIKVPENCFVDSSGNKIKGEVELVFEEFLSPGSIISSQISMKYDSAGKISDFESAGMFRINAFQNGQEVFIAKDKSLKVSLATMDAEKNFNTYYSTANGSDWKYLETSAPVENSKRKDAISNAAAPQIPRPVEPVAFTSEGKYFDLNLSRSQTPLLKNLLGVVWQYAGNIKKEDPALNPKCFNRKWDYVNILPVEGDKRGLYTIMLQDKDTTISTRARPVFRGAVLDAANEEFKQELGKFNEIMNQVKNEVKQSMAEAAFLRVVEVKNLGLYNYDRQYKEPDMTPVYASFNFGADSLRNYPISVFLITGNGMAVIKYPPHDWEKFAYARHDVNKMIAILPNQEICTFSAQRFKKEGPVFPAEAPGKFTFILNHTGVKASSSKEIDQVLSSI